MGWNGYFTIGGSEFINGPRTEQYAAGAGAKWLRPQFENDALAPMLGVSSGNFTDPVTDAAPWYDPDVPESADFFGFYPLDVSGIEDSTRGSTVTEGTGEGGSVGRLRHGTKSVVFNGALVGLTEKSVEYGARWLRRTLLGGGCQDIHGSEAELAFLSVAPALDTDPATAPDVEVRKYQRFLRNFLVNQGPLVTSKRIVKAGCEGAVWLVTFTGVAGLPFEFGPEEPLLQGWLDPAVTDPWVPGVSTGNRTDVAASFAETDCGVDTWTPIYDPLCEPSIVPPIPPSIPLGCFTPPATWDRRQVTITADNVPMWGTVLPVVTLYAPEELRNVRLRLYSDPQESLDPNTDPCAWSSDIVVSYLPAEATMTIDAASEEVWVHMVTGEDRRGDALLFTTAGKPVDFPYMTCGYQHIITVDTPVGSTPPVVDLGLVHRVV